MKLIHRNAVASLRRPRKFDTRGARVALLASALILLPGCDRDMLRREINQGAYQVFQTGLSGIISHLSGQIATRSTWSASSGASSATDSQP